MTGDLTVDARLDTNGHAWIMSANMAHSPDDISPAGTLTGDDETVVYDIPFDVEVDGTAYGSVCISTNGFVVLTNSTTCSSLPGNYSLPTSSYSVPIIAAYWDDLETEGNGIRYNTVGTSPNRMTYIDYEAHTYVFEYDVRFQIQIHETSGLINVRYRDPMHPSANGQGATIGFQTAGGSSARAYPIVYNGKALDDNADNMSWSVSPVR